MKAFDIVVVGPKSGVHLSGDIPLFIEKVRIPRFLFVEGGTKTLANEVFLWGGCRSHTVTWVLGSYAL